MLAGSDFDEVFLRRDKGGATPDVFVWQDAVTPGMKLVDIRVNDNLAEHTEVHFVDNGKQRVAPCLTREQLISLGIKIALYDDRTPVTDKTMPPVSRLSRKFPHPPSPMTPPIRC